MKTSLKGIVAALVGISAFVSGNELVTSVADAASGKLLLPGKRSRQTGSTGGSTTTPTTAPAPSSVSSATVLVDAARDLSHTGANDVAAARALFRSASYPESSGGLDASASLLNGIAIKAGRIIDAELGSSVDGSGAVAMPARLRETLSSLKRHGYAPHVVVGQRQPAYATRPGSEWTRRDWNAYTDYATSFVRAVAVQFEQTGFAEALFEVGDEIVSTQDPAQLWTLANPAVGPGDDARYQHYMRVYQVWSKAVDRVAKEQPSRILRIGGPAMGGQSLYLASSYWHERFVHDVASGGMRLDAVTLHFYGDILNGWANAPGSALKPQLQRVRQALQSAGRGNVPIFLTEYGPSEGSDPVFGRINYSHEGAAWAATFLAEAVAGTATVGSYSLVRDNVGTAATGVPGIASLDHTHGGVDYPKPAYNALRMYTLLPGTRKAVTVATTQPDVRAFASADAAGAGLLMSNYNFRYNWPSDATDLTVSQTVTPGFYNLPFKGAVAVERYLVDANTSNVARFIDAQQAPDYDASMLTRVEHCAATVDQAGALLLPPRVLSSSAVSLWLVKSGAVDGLQPCATQVADSGTTPSTGTTTPSTGTTTPSTGTTTPTTGTTTPTTGTTTPTTGTTGASADFAARCNAAGVIKCVGFDSTSDLAGAYGDNSGKFDGPIAPIQIDSVTPASGAGSLKFTIPSKSQDGSSGYWFTNFSPDLSVQFGENSEFYVQWRQRFSPEFISTFYQGSGGIKQVIITTGDQPGKLYASCEAIGVVVQTYYMARFPILYNSCTGSTSHGAYDPFFQPFVSAAGEDFKLQNARPTPYCLYSQQFGTRGLAGLFPPYGNCFGWFPNEWMTFQVRIKTGPRVNDEFTKSYISLWMAREGQPSQLVIDYGPYNLSAGSIAENQRYGKVWLLPYQTGKDPTQVHPTAYTWYDELIVSRAKIADPSAGTATSAPSTGTTTPTTDTTTPTTGTTTPTTGTTTPTTDTTTPTTGTTTPTTGTTQPPDGSLPAWIPAPGTVADVSLNYLSAVDPCPAQNCSYSGSAGQRNIYFWSGNTYAKAYGTYGSLINTSGGHNGYYGNEVYRYDIYNRVWSRITEPYANLVVGPSTMFVDTWNGESYVDASGSTTLQDQPGAFQSYTSNTYLPPGVGGSGPNGALLTPIRAAMSASAASTGNRAHVLDFGSTTPRWVRFSANLAGGASFAAAALDTKRNQVYVLDSANDGYDMIRVLDLSTKMWRTQPISAGIFQGPLSLQYAPSLDLLFYYAKSSVVIIDPNTWTVHRVGTTGPAPTTTNARVIAGGNFGGGEWVDSLNGYFYYMGDTSRTLYKLTPSASPKTSAWTWTAINFTGAAPVEQDGTDAAIPHYSRLHYVEPLGIFLWHGATTAPVQAWRLP